ncbi:MAG TPA: YihY/virulence factor BrkB family protein [Bacteroidales bacterium]|nr:YihY/virulence factor BrkB family protein [Bacteroidales bacterium]
MATTPFYSFKTRRKIIRFMQIPVVHKTTGVLKKLVIPGFQSVPFWDVMKFFFESLFQGILFQRAAAMTYYIFATAIPMLMALVAAISFLGDSFHNTMLEMIQSATPSTLWPTISEIINSLILQQNSAILYLSIGLGIYLSFLSVNSIVTTLNISYFDMEKRTFIKQLPISFIMVIVFLIIIIASCAIFIGASYFISHLNTKLGGSATLYATLISIFKWLSLFTLMYLLLSALFYFTPYKKEFFRFFSAGSTFSSIMLVILMKGINYYFANFSSYNAVYGSIGGILLILIWINWSCVVVLIGFDLNVSISIAQHRRKNASGELKIISTVKD